MPKSGSTLGKYWHSNSAEGFSRRAGRLSRLFNIFNPFKSHFCEQCMPGGEHLDCAFSDAVLNSTSDAVISIDVDGRIVQWNRGAEDLFGYLFEEALGRDADLLVAPLGRILAGEGRRGVFDATIQGRPFHGDSVRVAKDGTVIDVNITSSRIVGADGKILGVTVIIRDIRDRKTIESQLLASKERFQNLFDYAIVGIALTRMDGTIEQVNPAFCDMLGRSAAELIGTSFYDFLPREQWPSNVAQRRSLELNPTAKFATECTIHRRDGTVIICKLMKTTITGTATAEPLVVLRLIDITAEQAAVTGLAASEARFRGLFEHSLAGIVIRDQQGFIEDCNDAFGNLVGYGRDELIGANFSRLLPIEWQANAQMSSDAAMAGGEGSLLSNEGPLLHKAGHMVWVRSTVSALPQPEGKISKIVSFHIDVTESHRISDQLLKSERRLRMTTEATGGGAWDFDISSGETWWSDNMLDLWGVPKGTAMTLDQSLSLIHEQDREQVRNVISNAIAQRSHYNCEYRVNNPDKGVRWISSIGRLDSGAKEIGDHFVGMCFDITDLKRVEQVINENVAITTQLARIADAAPGVIFTFKLRPDGRAFFPYASEKMLDVFGLEPSSVRGTAAPWLSRIDPADQEAVNESREVSARSLSTWQNIYRYEHPTKGLIWLEAYSSPTREEDGSITWHGVAHDVTTRKNYEAAIDSLRQSNAIAAISVGMTHDVNNMLTVISGNLELLQNEVAGSKGKEWLAAAMDAATSGASINKRLLRLSGNGANPPAVIDLNTRALEIAPFLQRLLGDTIQIETELATSSTLCRVDFGELNSAILNLAVNARDAMNGIGNIVVTTAAVHIREDEAQALGSDAHAGDYVRLALTDTGCGMPPEIIKRVGEPFFTTKECGKGTGLGLFSVRAFARDSGGFVTIESSPLSGSTVSIYFPSIAVESVKLPIYN